MYRWLKIFQIVPPLLGVFFVLFVFIAVPLLWSGVFCLGWHLFDQCIYAGWAYTIVMLLIASWVSYKMGPPQHDSY